MICNGGYGGVTVVRDGWGGAGGVAERGLEVVRIVDAGVQSRCEFGSSQLSTSSFEQLTTGL